MINGVGKMAMKLILDLIKLLKSKEYGVGDSLPDSLDYSKLESHDVYQSKKIVDIVNTVTNGRVHKVEPIESSN